MILDATCGTRGTWYDKYNEDTVYLDRRFIKNGKTRHGRNLKIIPDIVADNRFLPFKDGIFDMVYYDPPHIIENKEKGQLQQLYSVLKPGEWVQSIYKATREFLRVLKMGGFVVFKWSERDRSLSRVINMFPSELKRLFGTASRISSKGFKTWWIVFRKV